MWSQISLCILSYLLFYKLLFIVILYSWLPCRKKKKIPKFFSFLSIPQEKGMNTWDWYVWEKKMGTCNSTPYFPPLLDTSLYVDLGFSSSSLCIRLGIADVLVLDKKLHLNKWWDSLSQKTFKENKSYRIWGSEF